ncbi:MAG: MTH1187 family thiamine-binding protein [Thermoplasmata archaeon]|nr:MTH1187 family thiamine-binding protein [Thermoplasmata archaeon]
MVIAEISVAPLTEGVSVSKYVKAAYRALENTGLKIQLTPMATIIEADTVEEIFDAALKAHRAVVEMGAKRIITYLKIDDRRDKKVKMEDKIESVIGK